MTIVRISFLRYFHVFQRIPAQIIKPTVVKEKKKLEIKIAIISIIVLFFFFCRSKNRAGHRSIERMVTFFPYNDKKETMRDEEDEKNRGETRSECNTSFRGGDRNWNGNDIQ